MLKCAEPGSCCGGGVRDAGQGEERRCALLTIFLILLFDARTAYTMCNNAATLDALAAHPKLKALVPYFARCFGAVGNGSDRWGTPRILNYGAGRRAYGDTPTLDLPKVDGLGQGLVSSTANYNITAAAALKDVRNKYAASAIIPAFIDDLTAVVAPEATVALFDDTQKALKDNMGGELNLGLGTSGNYRSNVAPPHTFAVRKAIITRFTPKACAAAVGGLEPDRMFFFFAFREYIGHVLHSLPCVESLLEAQVAFNKQRMRIADALRSARNAGPRQLRTLSRS